MTATNWFLWLMFDPVGLLFFGMSMTAMALALGVVLELFAGSRK